MTLCTSITISHYLCLRDLQLVFIDKTGVDDRYVMIKCIEESRTESTNSGCRRNFGTRL
jgi:hypothetical protein